jgi:hypothetical protein
MAFGERPQHPCAARLLIVKGFDAQVETANRLGNPTSGSTCICEFAIDFTEVHRADHSTGQNR